MSLENLKKHSLVYLASPYSSYRYGLDAAFRDVSHIAGRLLTDGVSVLSPIAHSHPLSIYGFVPNDYDIWIPYDFKLLDRCDALCVALMEGWESSKGIRLEIERARGLKWDDGRWINQKPVYYVDPDTLDVF